MEGNSTIRLQEAAAKLLSDLREGCTTSQKSVDTCVKEMNNLTNLYLDVLKERFQYELSAWDGHIEMHQVMTVLDIFKNQSIFEGLEKGSEMESYLREISGGQKVLLKQVVLKFKSVIRKGRPVKVPVKFGYFVPFLPQLEQLLNCQDVLECVDNPLPSEKGVYRNITDGLFYRYHPVVLKNGPTTLAIFIHVDDAETCDALKSKAGKHSLRLFYWSLGNIHPKKRSSLRAINLLAIARARVCKEFGNEFLLKSFVQDLIKLGNEGVELNVNGELRRFYAVLVFAACDNPAAANLGKFKETHSALRSCRVCMTKTSEMCEQHREIAALLRKKGEHEKQVQKVEAVKNPDDIIEVIDIYNEEEEEMEVDEEAFAEQDYSDHKDPSINYGINGRSILSSVPEFDVTKCLPQDLMHLLNEGVVEMVCRLVLRDLCLPPTPRARPLIPLEDLNKCIDSLCDLGHLEASKPSEIEKKHITGKKLKQSASQMLVLLRLLPFITFNRCSEEKRELILKLIHIVDLCLAYEKTDSDIERLRDMIEDFKRAFAAVYPGRRSLKLHCLIHLATQCKLHGPLRQQACFHFERMHSKFTRIFSVVRSMKNPPLSTAVRHLASRNAEISQCKNGDYLTTNDGFVGLKVCQPSDLAEKDCLIEKFPGVTEVTKVQTFLHRGSQWKEGVIMLLGKEEPALFGRIQSVFMVDSNVFFSYNILKTNYITSYNAFEILKCEQKYEVLSFVELKHQFPMWRISFSFPKSRLKSYIIVQNPLDS